MYKGVVKLVDIKAAFTGCVEELQCTSKLSRIESQLQRLWV